MKRILIISFFLVVAHLGLSQNIAVNDPTYSANNYKHPNKAAYAKKHMVNAIIFERAKVSQLVNYKKPYSLLMAEVFVIPASKKASKSRKSYKHPQGL